MDGEQLTFNLGIYKEKYYENHIKNEPKNCDTDKEDVQIQLLNDYVGIQLKGEASTFEESRTLKVVKLCSATHGGTNDNPKTVTASVANIVEKWDFCYNKFVNAHSEPPDGRIINNKCYCFEKDRTAPDDHISESSLVDTIIECTEKIVLHGQTFSKVLQHNGEAQKLIVLLSSMKFVKNRVLLFKDIFGKTCKKDFLDNELEDISQSLFTQCLEYYRSLLGTEVLHDAESNDWASNIPFYENQRISTSIQFWAYTMQGLRADFFNILPEKMAKKGLHELLKRSLDILTVRYCQIKPSSKRIAQFRADISVILYVCHDMLLSLIPDLRSMFHPDPRNVATRSVHQKCLVLMLALVMVGCPIKNMERYIESLNEESAGGQNGAPPKRLDPIHKGDDERLTCWLHLAFPGIYGNVPERLNTPSLVFLLGRIVAVQPSPNWPIIARLCLSRDMEFPALIMRNFGAFIPGIRGDSVNVRGLSRTCCHFLCNKRCIPSADIHWPQEVGSSVLYVVMHGNKDKEALKKVLSPLISKLNASAWAVLNKNMLWNLKRPVWLQGLIDLLEPYVFPVVDELMDDVESGRTWTLSHVPEAIVKLMSGLNEVSCVIPDSFFEVCSMIKPLVPEEVNLVCNSFLIHVFVSSLYGIINKIIPVMRAWKMQREKIDFLVAVGEKLCNLEPNEDTRMLENHEPCVYVENITNWDELPEEFASTASEIAADKILIEPHGQTAFKVIHRFLTYNSEWLEKTLGVTVRGVDTLAEKPGVTEAMPVELPKLVPWDEDIFRTPTPKEMVSHCCFFQYNAMLTYQPIWEDCLRTLLPEMNPFILRQLMTNRSEVQENDTAEEADTISHDIVLNYLNDQLLDKVVYEK